MIKRIISIILITIFIHGCATKLPPKVVVPKSAKIGVMLLIDEKPKHIYVGTTVFSNFEKDNVSNWDAKSRIEKYLKNELSHHQVISIKPSAKLLSNSLEFITSGWDTLHLNKELVNEISTVTKSSNIDFLVTIEPYAAPVEYNSAVYTDGYGLFTRCMFGICRAEALSHVTTRVYAMNPPRLVSWSAAPKGQLSVEISSFDNLKNLAISEIDKAKNPFISYMYNDSRSALLRAGLK